MLYPWDADWKDPIEWKKNVRPMVERAAMYPVKLSGDAAPSTESITRVLSEPVGPRDMQGTTKPGGSATRK